MEAVKEHFGAGRLCRSIFWGGEAVKEHFLVRGALVLRERERERETEREEREAAENGWRSLKRATDIQSLPQKRCAGKQKGMGVVVKLVVQGPVKQLLLQILVVVAIIQMGILKCEVD